MTLRRLLEKLKKVLLYEMAPRKPREPLSKRGPNISVTFSNLPSDEYPLDERHIQGASRRTVRFSTDIIRLFLSWQVWLVTADTARRRGAVIRRLGSPRFTPATSSITFLASSETSLAAFVQTLELASLVPE